ncbi:uncharacterized protein A1O9_00908 [Exophiala aquamarina CBS 119918]|uniref:C2H2-type domain-containing protein n=1 Tax=Exophiala aquamarina CBS 119918 TaxID=1182545 RepID=A0A072PS60_9EURO|nr:uncharacterized protein A1O9_00908 [Exophiala aquamarina CBS 119918]KEF62934.1 hypothetical protein A1O9_00908 [Exophiala aquamarina CBS 119918]
MSWAHSEFSTHQFNVRNDSYEPHTYIMSLSPVSASVSASPGVRLQQHEPIYRNEFTPRFQPNPFAQTFQHHQYHDFEAYSCSTSPTTTRGRSSSGDTASYMSTPTTPPETEYLNGFSSQYAVQSSQQICSNTVTSAQRYLTRSPPSGDHGDKTPRVANDGSSPSSDKTVTKRSNSEMWCPHSDCHNEEGVPQRRFSRKADVSRHYSSQHNPKYMDCPKRNCGRKGKDGFTRKDHLVEHLRGFHMEAIAKRETGVKVLVKKGCDDKSNSRKRNGLQNAYCHEMSKPAGPKHEGQVSLQGSVYSMDGLQVGETFDDQGELQQSRMLVQKARMLARRHIQKDQGYSYPRVLELEDGSQKRRTTVKQERNEPQSLRIPQEPMQHLPIQTQPPGFNLHQDLSPQDYTSNTMTFSAQYPSALGYHS